MHITSVSWCYFWFTNQTIYHTVCQKIVAGKKQASHLASCKSLPNSPSHSGASTPVSAPLLGQVPSHDCQTLLSVLHKMSEEWLINTLVFLGCIQSWLMHTWQGVKLKSAHMYSDLRRNNRLYYSPSCVVFTHVGRAYPKQRNVSIRHNSDLRLIFKAYFWVPVSESLL